MEPPRARSRPARSAEANRADARKLLGRRISLLFRIQGDPQHPFSEAVGVLQRVEGADDDPTLVLVRRSGELVDVASSAIVRMKVIG